MSGLAISAILRPSYGRTFRKYARRRSRFGLLGVLVPILWMNRDLVRKIVRRAFRRNSTPADVSNVIEEVAHTPALDERNNAGSDQRTDQPGEMTGT